MSTCWGKDCLPVHPKSDFSATSIVLIDAVIGMVFSAHLSQHAVRVSLKRSFDRFARLYWFGSLRLFQMMLRTVIFCAQFFTWSDTEEFNRATLCVSADYRFIAYFIWWKRISRLLKHPQHFFILIFVSMYTDQTFIWSVKHQPVILKVVLSEWWVLAWKSQKKR